jgi:parvulin-like peptidyl-prolyl isomerase
MKKKLFAAAMVLAASVAPMRGEIIEQVLVKVNGEIITKTELEQRQVSVLRQRMQGQQIDAESLKNDETLKKALAEVTPQLIVNSVDELLLLQRGRELGLRLGDDQFKAVVNNIRKEQGLQDEAKFQAALAQEGMTMDDLVTVQVFCTDLSLYGTFNDVYRTYFTKGFPARAFLGTGSLLAGGRFGVQGIAVKQ